MEWKEIKEVSEEWYDGPISRVVVGKYEHEEVPRLEISIGAHLAENGMVAARFTLDEIEEWLREARATTKGA